MIWRQAISTLNPPGFPPEQRTNSKDQKTAMNRSAIQVRMNDMARRQDGSRLARASAQKT
jgi:hypothetical protein